MLRLSVPVRQGLARLTLPVLVVAAFLLMLAGRADMALVSRSRMALTDALFPIEALLARPAVAVQGWIAFGHHLMTLAEDNERLRTENATLRRWQAVALALDTENAALQANLRWIPDQSPPFVTARAVADVGGVYARAVLIAAGLNNGLVKGEIALDDRGLVGRVTEIGARSMRVLLITDLNSRIPVTLETSRARAILTGTNGPRPRLMFWPEGVMPAEGEHVVTSAEAGVFPAGLPVGTVHYSSSNVPEVEPLARLDRLEVVRLFDYGLHGVLPPEASVIRLPGSSAPGRSGSARLPSRPAASLQAAPVPDLPGHYQLPH